MWFSTPSGAGFDADLIVDCLSQALFTSQILFGGLYRDVAQKKLNLFYLATSAVAQSGAGPTEVMRCQCY
jgi:hypothetical protein